MPVQGPLLWGGASAAGTSGGELCIIRSVYYQDGAKGIAE